MLNTVDSLYAEILDRREQLHHLWRTIHDNPELGHREEKACRLQLELLRQSGVEALQSPWGGLSTSFCAQSNPQQHPAVAFLAEYDALPQLGHGCGHSLIATAAMAAFLAARAIQQHHNIPGNLQLIGTPAEEQFGGKVDILNAGGFQQTDYVLESHPFRCAGADRKDLAVSRFNVTFHGKSSHAAVSPSLGINALDAINLLFHGINCWRQQLPPGAMIHGIITHGGDAANIIPERTSGFFYLRARENRTIQQLEERFRNIVRGAALMTGCQSEVSCGTEHPYSANCFNPTLANLAEQIAAETFHWTVEKEIPEQISTDFANVSTQKPGLHFFFPVFEPDTAVSPLHSQLFQQASGKEFAFEQALKAGAIMAQCAIACLTDRDFRNKVQEDFKNNRERC